MTRTLLTLLACLAAQPALALSCLPPDPVALYERARDAEESFMIIRGRILAEARVNLPREGKEAETPVRIEGLALTAEGFTEPFDRDATLRLTCAGPWCANAPSGGEVFMAVEVDGRDLIAEIGPCYFNQVEATDEGAARLLSCHQGGDCVTKY